MSIRMFSIKSFKKKQIRLLLLIAIVIITNALNTASALIRDDAIGFIDEPDEDGQIIPFKKLIGYICGSHRWLDLKHRPQIGHISTIIKLAEHFQETSIDSGYLSCYQHYNAMKDLENIVTTSNDNVCDPKKINLIEKFHWRYIAGFPVGESLLPILNDFFYNYATQIDAMCKRTLLLNLETDVEKALSKEEVDYIDTIVDGCSLGVRHWSNLKQDFAKQLELSNKANVIDQPSMDEQLALCNALRSLGLKFGHANLSEIKRRQERRREQLYDRKVPIIAVRNINKIDELRQRCALIYRPYYSQLIQPVVRLSLLGYSSSTEINERELNALRESRLAMRWFSITPICQSVLDASFVVSSSLAPGQVKVFGEVIRNLMPNLNSEQKKLDSIKAHHYKSEGNSLVGEDKIWALSHWSPPSPEGFVSEKWRRLRQRFEAMILAAAPNI